jgi:hypothetical protein
MAEPGGRIAFSSTFVAFPADSEQIACRHVSHYSTTPAQVGLPVRAATKKTQAIYKGSITSVCRKCRFVASSLIASIITATKRSRPRKIPRVSQSNRMPGRHFVLDEPYPQSQAEKLLGRIVLDIKSPLRAFAPRDHVEGTSIGRNPQDIIQDILPSPVLSTDRKDFIKNNISGEARTDLTDFFGFNFARTEQEKLTLESKVVKRYSLEQTKDVFETLIKDPSYNSEVRKFFKEHGVRKAYFVVGFITTEGSVWTRERKREYSAGINTQVPLSAVAMVPVPGIDPSVELSGAKHNTRGQSFSSDEGLIFAVAYDVIKLKKTFDKTAPGYFRDDLTFGPAKYAKARYLAMGEDDDEIIEEEEGEDEGATSEDDIELDSGLDLEDIDIGWQGLSFDVGLKDIPS